MANLVIASVCNLHCPYCFAQEYLATSLKQRQQAFISPEAFEARLDFLERSKIKEARLIGGEPTLHPQFTELVQRARRRGFKIAVFSHGLISESALTCLEELPIDECGVLVNMNASRGLDGPTAEEIRQRHGVIERLGQRAQLSFTIFDLDFQLEPLLPLVLSTGCKPGIRLGLAQPVLEANNRYLHPKLYPEAGKKIVAFAQQAARDGIRLEFDCGFVRCMFSDEQVATLKEFGTDLDWRCNPILDIDLQGSVIHCFPLTGKSPLSLTIDDDAASLRARFSAVFQPYRSSGIYRECSICALKLSGSCTGGCLASTISRFRTAKFTLKI